MHKKLAALILIAASALTLTGCAPQNDADNPAQGRWVTIKDDANGKLLGDVWCINSSQSSGRSSFDCQWSSLTRPGTHEDAEQVSGNYRYVAAANGEARKTFCIDYSLRKNSRMINCDWEGVTAR